MLETAFDSEIEESGKYETCFVYILLKITRIGRIMKSFLVSLLQERQYLLKYNNYHEFKFNATPLSSSHILFHFLSLLYFSSS